MAHLTLFRFHPGKSGLHRLDARGKILSLIALGLTALSAGPWGLGVFSLFTLGLIGGFRLSFSGLFSMLRYLLVFLGFLWIARVLFTPGRPLISIPFLTATREGVVEGGLLVWRMGLVIFLSLVYTASTRPTQTREAVHRLLRPFPFIPGQQIADMMGLMTRFLPVILNRIDETAEAQRSRAVENRKNPIYRIKTLTVPVLRGLFVDAHALSEAMEARCYNPSRPPAAAPLNKTDWMTLTGVLFLCLTGLVL